MERKKVLLGMVLVIIVYLIIGGIVIDKNPVRIGILGDFSTSLATESIDAYRAIELALEEIDAESQKYELVRIDFPRYSSIKDLKKVIEFEELEVIIGPSTSSHYFKLKPMLLELDLPVFLIAVSSNDVNEKYDNLFRLSDDITDHSNALSHIVEEYLSNQSCIIYYTSQNKDFSESLALYLSQEISRKQDSIEPTLIEIGNLSDEETQKILLEERKEKCAIIIAPPGTAGNIGKFVAQVNQEIALVFTEWSTSTVTLEYLEGLSNSMYFLTAPPPDYEERLAIFSRKIVNEKRGNNNIFSLTGYEMMYFID